MWYWGVAETDPHLHWLEDQLLDVIIEKVKAHELGHLPKDEYKHRPELPAQPVLLQCVWGGSEETVTLHIAPKDLIAWKSREDAIRTFTEEFKNQYGVATLLQEPVAPVRGLHKPISAPPPLRKGGSQKGSANKPLCTPMAT